MSSSKLNTAVLYAHYTDKLSYYDDWLNAFETHHLIRSRSFNICESEHLRQFRKSIREYDAIVLLHSVNADTLAFLDPLRSLLKDRKCRLLTFVGNEVNLPRVSMKDKIEFFRDIAAEFIATQLPLEAGKWLYAECASSRVVALPHALNPDVFQPVIAQRERPIDIGVRSQQYWSCLGDNERNNLFDFFRRHPFSMQLKIDIDTAIRYDRSGWADFLNRCKGTVSNEAGSYYLERNDETVRRIQEDAERNWRKDGSTIVKPDSPAETIWRLLPEPLRQSIRGPLVRFLKTMKISYYSDVYSQLDFQETYDRYFRDTPRCPVHSKAVSSRHFDAIGTKTCQIMLRGRFNDILDPDEHYIALEQDFSNADEAMARFMDEGYRQTMVDHTYEYVVEHHTYRHRVDAFYELMQLP